jgi:hypothetical protein
MVVMNYQFRGDRSLRLPTEPCVRVRTRLLMQGVSIEKLQTNVPAFGRIELPTVLLYSMMRRMLKVTGI